MELLYVYIGKYRGFSDQEISFSNKFTVEYNKKDNRINIVKNEKFLDIYPKHIVGINALIGKNASGKTSVLDLIGKQITNRRLDNEISSQFDEDVELGDDYYFLYYYGKNSENEDLFIFETCNIKKYYQSILINLQENDAIYFDSNAWFAGECTYENGQLIYNYASFDNDYFKERSITYFMRNNYVCFSKNDDESVISVKRRMTLLENDFKYNQIQFLINQMGESDLYNRDNYSLDIKYNYAIPELNKLEKEKYINENGEEESVYWDFNDIIINAFGENDEISFDFSKNIILKFCYKFLCYIFENILKINRNISDNQIKCLNDLQNSSENLSSFNYEDWLNYYRKQVEIIFDYFNEPYRKLPFGKNVNVDEFSKIIDSFNILFETVENDIVDVSCEDDILKVILKKNTDISRLKEFFDCVIDEYVIKTNKYINSTLQDFISTEINFLSDGERVNLAMFTAIHEQISKFTDGKKDYILLFDEIERSMHPEMCRNLINDLIKFLGQYNDKNFQIIIASHSPFIISDILRENINCLKYNLETRMLEIRKAKNNTFGQNIHTLLKNEFFLNNTIGEFSKHHISEILKLLSDDNDVQEISSTLNDLIGKEVVLSDKEAYDYLEKFISKIGEPIIRNSLQEVLRLKYKKISNIDDDIIYYEKKLAELKREKEKRSEND